MGKSRFKVPIKKNQSFTLNITSMTDMFTIMLVFLLQSFASGEVAIDLVQGISLPSSNSEKNPVNGVKLAISPTELKFETRTIASVKNNEIEIGAIDPNDSKFIKPLFDELKKVNAENEKLAKTGKVLLQADQSLPYGVISKVLYTASMAGFPNLKLVTTVGE
ncbi:MAG: ExbD/TolR family protein [Pseudobdellovibrio sp.]